jgi:tetratricopeptide (TPR) repeat protein
MTLDAIKDDNKKTMEAAKKKYDEGSFEESRGIFLQAIIEIKYIIVLDDKEGSLSYKAVLARMQKNVAIINSQLGNYLESLSYFLQELDTLKAMPEWQTNHNVFDAYYSVATSYKVFGDAISSDYPDKAMDSYTMALDYYKKDLELRSKLCPAPDQGVSVVFKDIGFLYVTLGDPDRAEPYLLSFLNTRKELYGLIQEAHEELGEVHQILGEFYENEKDYGKSLKHYLAAKEIYIERHPSDEALHELSPGILVGIYRAGVLLGDFYENQKDYGKSLEHYNIAKDTYTLLHPSDKPSHELLSAVLTGIIRVEALIEEASSVQGNGGADDRVDAGTDGDNKASDRGGEEDALTLEEDASPSEGSNYNSGNAKQENTDQDNLQLANVFLKSLYAWLEQLPEWMQNIMLNSAPVKSAIESAKQEAAMYNPKYMLVKESTEETVSEIEEFVSGVLDDKASIKPIENMFDTSMMLSDPSFNYQVILPVAGIVVGMASDQIFNPANALDMGNLGIFG